MARWQLWSGTWASKTTQQKRLEIVEITHHQSKSPFGFLIVFLFDFFLGKQSRMAFGDCRSWLLGCCWLCCLGLEGARCLMQKCMPLLQWAINFIRIERGGAGRTIKYKASQHLSCLESQKQTVFYCRCLLYMFWLTSFLNLATQSHKSPNHQRLIMLIVT